MPGALIPLIVFIAIVLVSLPSLIKCFQFTYLTALVCSPLFLITWSWLVHSVALVLAHLFNFDITLRLSSKIALFSWLIYACSQLRKRDFEKIVQTSLRNWQILSVSLLSVTVWAIGIGGGGPPKDNDALSNAFDFRRVMSMVDYGFCQISGETSRYINIRFESCGVAVLAHDSNFFGLVSVDSLLNFAYLTNALLLPISAVAFIRLIWGRNENDWIASLIALSFVFFPYATNGLMRLSFAMPFFILVSAMLISFRRLNSNQLSGLAVSLVAVGFIHLLAFVVLIIVWGFQVLIELYYFVRFKYRLDSYLDLTKRTMFIIPSVFVVVFTGKILRSALNTISIATGGVTGDVTGGVENWGSVLSTASDVLEHILLKNIWTPAQPSLTILSIFGLVLLDKSRDNKISGISAMFYSLYTLYVITFGLGIENSVASFLFLDNWYRNLMFIVALMIPLTGIGCLHFFNQINSGILKKAAVFGFSAVLLVHIYEGGSVVNSAWARNTGVSREKLEALSSLKPFKDVRTLNDPTDGSSWAFVRVGMNITSPNDRERDRYFGSIVDKLGDDLQRTEVCNVIREQRIEAVLWVNGSTEEIKLLQNLRIIDQVLVNQKQIFLGKLSTSFVNSCNS